MPHHPEDDWTRPMPRTPRAGRDAGRDRWADDPGGWTGDPDRTERIPRGGRAADRDEWSGDRSRDPGRTQQIPRGQRGGQERPDRYRHEPDGYAYDDHDDDRPPIRPAGPPPGRPPRRRRPRYRVRRVVALLALLLVAYLVTMIVVLAQVWGSVDRVDASPDVPDRPGGAAGENYLLVGTDSREQLTDEQRADFGTGATEGHRADTVMLLHVPTLGDPTLVSLPRDSYVEIRDLGLNKLNSAHAIGGPELLVDTVEQSTGLPVSGYLEIGFGGFVSVVDGVGGVQMCLDEPLQDDRAHLDLPAGCQDLSGAEALGYVRMRYSDPRGDIGRVERQRELLSALVDQVVSPATVLVPWRLHQVGTATGEAIALSEDTSMFEAARMALAMRAVSTGQGNSVTVPVADADYPTPVGSAVLWDEPGATQLFAALRQGQAITVDP